MIKKVVFIPLIIFLTASILFVISNPFVTAEFGIASRYYENRPLEIAPGQTIDAFFLIQNTIGETRDITVEATLIQGSEIASFIDGPTYDVSAGEQVKANLRIEVPENAPIDSEYDIEALFKQVSAQAEGEGTIQFVINVGKRFKVIVIAPSGEESQQTESPIKTNNILLCSILGILSLLILIISITIYLLIKKEKEESSVSSQQILNT